MHRKVSQKERSRLRIKWEDATSLVTSFVDDLKFSDNVLGRALIKAVFSVENGSWRKYVAFLHEEYGIRPSDGRLSAVREKLVSILSKIEGYENIIKRISTD